MKIRFMQLMDADIESNVSRFEINDELKKNSWRLPSLDEMILIFNDQAWNKNINFENNWYIIDQNSTGIKPIDKSLPAGHYVYQFNFSNGEHGWRDCTEDHWGLANVRLIRSEIHIKQLVRNGNSISDLALQPCDMGEKSWDEANILIDKLGDGWRLPTIQELDIIYTHSEFCRKEMDFNFTNNKRYWVSDKRSDAEQNEASYMHICTYESDSLAGYVGNTETTNSCVIRAIKSIK